MELAGNQDQEHAVAPAVAAHVLDQDRALDPGPVHAAASHAVVRRSESLAVVLGRVVENAPAPVLTECCDTGRRSISLKATATEQIGENVCFRRTTWSGGRAGNRPPLLRPTQQLL